MEAGRTQREAKENERVEEESFKEGSVVTDLHFAKNILSAVWEKKL